MPLPKIRWCVFELRVPLDRDVLLRVSLGLRALPGVAVVRVQPDTGRIAIGAAPGEPTELLATSLLASAGLSIRSISVGGPDPTVGPAPGPIGWPVPVGRA
jgi:hypothetical protein